MNGTEHKHPEAAHSSGSDSDDDGADTKASRQNTLTRNSTLSSPAAGGAKSSNGGAAGSDGAGGDKKESKLSRKEKRALKSKHRKINKQHPEFELTYDMMLGIRTVVGNNPTGHSLALARDSQSSSVEVQINGVANAESKAAAEAEAKRRRTRALAEAAAKEQQQPKMLKLSFPGKGSSHTPAHAMRDFKFKDYCSDVFRSIRDRFKIDPTEYLLCVCGNFQYLEFISNSKSGQFFFYSHDRQYMIKTISGGECKFLRQILPSYLSHIQQNPHTLLTRFYGMHRVKPHKKKEVHFLIMGSVFYTSKFVHTVFDLKGSRQGRNATQKEKDSGAAVYKDNDFLDMDIRIKIGAERSRLLNEQIARDVEWLRQLNIMDYSLLLGIHYKDRVGEVYGPGGDVAPAAASTAAGSNGAVAAGSSAAAAPPSQAPGIANHDRREGMAGSTGDELAAGGAEAGEYHRVRVADFLDTHGAQALTPPLQEDEPTRNEGIYTQLHPRTNGGGAAGTTGGAMSGGQDGRPDQETSHLDPISQQRGHFEGEPSFIAQSPTHKHGGSAQMVSPPTSPAGAPAQTAAAPAAAASPVAPVSLATGADDSDSDDESAMVIHFHSEAGSPRSNASSPTGGSLPPTFTAAPQSPVAASASAGAPANSPPAAVAAPSTPAATTTSSSSPSADSASPAAAPATSAATSASPAPAAAAAPLSLPLVEDKHATGGDAPIATTPFTPPRGGGGGGGGNNLNGNGTATGVGSSPRIGGGGDNTSSQRNLLGTPGAGEGPYSNRGTWNGPGSARTHRSQSVMPLGGGYNPASAGLHSPSTAAAAHAQAEKDARTKQEMKAAAAAAKLEAIAKQTAYGLPKKYNKISTPGDIAFPFEFEAEGGPAGAGNGNAPGSPGDNTRTLAGHGSSSNGLNNSPRLGPNGGGGVAGPATPFGSLSPNKPHTSNNSPALKPTTPQHHSRNSRDGGSSAGQPEHLALDPLPPALLKDTATGSPSQGPATLPPRALSVFASSRDAQMYRSNSNADQALMGPRSLLLPLSAASSPQATPATTPMASSQPASTPLAGSSAAGGGASPVAGADATLSASPVAAVSAIPSSVSVHPVAGGAASTSPAAAVPSSGHLSPAAAVLPPPHAGAAHPGLLSGTHPSAATVVGSSPRRSPRISILGVDPDAHALLVLDEHKAQPTPAGTAAASATVAASASSASSASAASSAAASSSAASSSSVDGAPVLSASPSMLPDKLGLFSTDGGCAGQNPDGTPNNELYFLGIIDILTLYNMGKKLENFGKSLKYKEADISAVNPTKYAERFKQFIGAALR